MELSGKISYQRRSSLGRVLAWFSRLAHMGLGTTSIKAKQVREDKGNLVEVQ